MVASKGSTSSAPSVTGSSSSAKRQKTIHPIEEANNKDDLDFAFDYLDSSSADWTQWTHPGTKETYELCLSSPGGMTGEELESCYHLIEETSGLDYRDSSFGWHPAAKKKEMRSPDLRYMLVTSGDGQIKGFTSMMPTWENHESVVYCYEIHLKPGLQGTGLGKQLMKHVMDVADRIPSVDKVMLTCFKSNAKAMDFYTKLGFIEDDYSPRERKLRGGKVVAPDYAILSRRTTAASGRQQQQRIENGKDDNGATPTAATTAAAVAAAGSTVATNTTRSENETRGDGN